MLHATHQVLSATRLYNKKLGIRILSAKSCCCCFCMCMLVAFCVAFSLILKWGGSLALVDCHSHQPLCDVAHNLGRRYIIIIGAQSSASTSKGITVSSIGIPHEASASSCLEQRPSWELGLQFLLFQFITTVSGWMLIMVVGNIAHSMVIIITVIATIRSPWFVIAAVITIHTHIHSRWWIRICVISLQI